jgi:hypothetical protein
MRTLTVLDDDINKHLQMTENYNSPGSPVCLHPICLECCLLTTRLVLGL